MVHNDLTICSVIGHNDGSAAIPALTESLDQLPGSRGLLISQSRPDTLPRGIAWKQTEPLTYKQYSIFVMHCLQYFVETDYCLIVQEDGWVLDGGNLSANFYDYDYIGAPCHAAMVGDTLKQQYTWIQNPHRIVVQNGGFSLRSRRFLEAPSRHGFAYRPDNRRPLFNEDIQLTGIFRPRLESLGYTFAPDQLAKHFAIEYLGPSLHDDLDFTRLVGHHAPTRRLSSYRTITCSMTPAQVSQSYGEQRVLHHLEHLGYSIRYRAPGRN